MTFTGFKGTSSFQILSHVDVAPVLVHELQPLVGQERGGGFGFPTGHFHMIWA